MSHEIEQNDTVTCADGEGTWHNINTLIIPEMLTFESTRLDWDVKQYPLVVDKSGTYVPVPDFKVNMRPDVDLPVGCVGNQYEVISNKEIYDNFMAVIDGRAEMVTAGSLFNCRRIWFLAKINDGCRNINGDRFDTYIMAMSSHDGSIAHTYMLTMERVVCNNTLQMAMRNGKNSVRIVHSGDTKVKMSLVQRFYDEIFEGIDKTQAVLEILAGKPCNLDTAYNWASGFIGAGSTKSQNISRQITNMFKVGKGNHGETRYDLLNGLTERFTHGDTSLDQTDDRTTKEFITSTFGSNNQKKLNALGALQDDEKFTKFVEIGKKLNADYLDSEAFAKTSSLVPLNIN